MDDPENTGKPATARSEFLASVLKGVLLGAAALAIYFPAMHWYKQQHRPIAPAAQVQMQPRAGAPVVVAQAPQYGPVKHASFNGEQPTEDVRQLANWSVYTHDHKNLNFIILDKKDARVWVFDNTGKLKAHSPVLLGQTPGDEDAPGIGDKPLSQIDVQDKKTAAGRFIGQMGMNAHNEDVVWVNYQNAISMHRVLTDNPDEKRLERLATPTPDDNRISYGCINLPKAFYEDVVAPTVRTGGAVIYVLPETKSAQSVFGSWDVDRPETRPPVVAQSG
jgi:hypothetical protein